MTEQTRAHATLFSSSTDQGEFIEDPEGAAFHGLQAARVEAVESAHCLIAEDIRNGEPVLLSDAVEIAGTDGLTVSTAVFRRRCLSGRNDDLAADDDFRVGRSATGDPVSALVIDLLDSLACP
jgi:hypothetical protein